MVPCGFLPTAALSRDSPLPAEHSCMGAENMEILQFDWESISQEVMAVWSPVCIVTNVIPRGKVVAKLDQ